MAYIIDSGSVLALQGTVPWSVLGGNQSVSGTVLVGNFPTTQNVSGSVLSFQGTTPWSVSGTVVVNNGSVVSFQGGPWSASLVGTIPGSVRTFQAGTVITSLVSITPSSVLVGASILGQLPAGTATIGSIVAIQGGTWKAHETSTALTALDTTYNDVTTSANSADVTTTGYRVCDLVFSLVSVGTGTHELQIIPQAKDGSAYFNMKNGFIGKFIFDDVAVSSMQSIHVTFPSPATGTMRVGVVGTNTSSVLTFTMSNTKLFLRT